MDVHPVSIFIVLHRNQKKSDDLVTGQEQHSWKLGCGSNLWYPLLGDAPNDHHKRCSDTTPITMILWLQKHLLVQLHPEVVHTGINQRTWFEAGYSSPLRPKSTMARHPIWRLEPHMTLEEPLLKSNMEPLLTLSVGIKFEFRHLESSAQRVHVLATWDCDLLLCRMMLGRS